MDRLWRATINTWNGLRGAAGSERAIREELAVLVAALPLAYIFGTTAARRVELIGVLLLLLAIELLNTAIEKLADRLTREHDPQIGRVKDIGSAAVGVAILLAGIVWLVALAEWAGLV